MVKLPQEKPCHLLSAASSSWYCKPQDVFDVILTWPKGPLNKSLNSLTFLLNNVFAESVFGTSIKCHRSTQVHKNPSELTQCQIPDLSDLASRNNAKDSWSTPCRISRLGHTISGEICDSNRCLGKFFQKPMFPNPGFMGDEYHGFVSVTGRHNDVTFNKSKILEEKGLVGGTAVWNMKGFLFFWSIDLPCKILILQM